MPTKLDACPVCGGTERRHRECVTCGRERRRAYQAAHLDAARGANRRSQQRRRERGEPYVWSAEYERNGVRSAVHYAIKKGRLVRPEQCSQCGRTCKPEAAHDDYSRPLDVRWLCRSCHVKWDRAQPKWRV